MCLFDNNEEQTEPENISEDDAVVNQAEECPKNDEPTQSFVYGQLIRAYNQINNICDYIDDVNNERFQDEFNEYNKNQTSTETPSAGASAVHVGYPYTLETSPNNLDAMACRSDGVPVD